MLLMEETCINPLKIVFFKTGVSSDTGLLKAVLFVEIDDILDVIL